MSNYTFLMLLSLVLPYIPSICLASDAVSNDYRNEHNSYNNQDDCFRDEDCQHGGKCSLADRFSEFNRCNCKHGWGGVACERPCPLSCQNNGACRPTLTNSSEYECVCHGDFTGDRCEIPFETCPDHSLCLHGGSCVMVNDMVQSYSCDCPPGFDASPSCTLNPNHIQPTMMQKLEQDAMGLESVTLIALVALGGVFALVVSIRACQRRRGYQSNVNTMKDDMEYSFNPKEYYFNARDLENIEMI